MFRYIAICYVLFCLLLELYYIMYMCILQGGAEHGVPILVSDLQSG